MPLARPLLSGAAQATGSRGGGLGWQAWRLNLVLTAGGEPVGMVSVATAPDTEGEVELISLWVAPAG